MSEPGISTTQKIRISIVLSIALVATVFVVDKAVTYRQQMRYTKAVAEIGGEFSLLNTDGQLQDTSQFKGRYRFVYFGFTYCPDMCPLALGTLQKVVRLMKERRMDPVAYFVSVDYERDTPAELASYIQHYGGDILAFTAQNQDQLRQVTSQYKAFYVKNAKSPEDKYYLIDHSPYIYFLDGDARFLAKFNYTDSPESIVQNALILINN